MIVHVNLLPGATVPLKMADVDFPLVATRNLVGSVVRPKSVKVVSDHLSTTSKFSTVFFNFAYRKYHLIFGESQGRFCNCERMT